MNWSTQRRLHWETVEVCLRSWSPWGGSWAHSLKEPSSRRRGGTHDLATSNVGDQQQWKWGLIPSLQLQRHPKLPPSMQPTVAAPRNLMTPHSSQLSPLPACSGTSDSGDFGLGRSAPEPQAVTSTAARHSHPRGTGSDTKGACQSWRGWAVPTPKGNQS